MSTFFRQIFLCFCPWFLDKHGEENVGYFLVCVVFPISCLRQVVTLAQKVIIIGDNYKLRAALLSFQLLNPVQYKNQIQNSKRPHCQVFWSCLPCRVGLTLEVKMPSLNPIGIFALGVKMPSGSDDKAQFWVRIFFWGWEKIYIFLLAEKMAG